MAVALILAGLTVSNIIGVPAGTAIGNVWGWRSHVLGDVRAGHHRNDCHDRPAAAHRRRLGRRRRTAERGQRARAPAGVDLADPDADADDRPVRAFHLHRAAAARGDRPRCRPGAVGAAAERRRRDARRFRRRQALRPPADAVADHHARAAGGRAGGHLCRQPLSAADGRGDHRVGLPQLRDRHADPDPHPGLDRRRAQPRILAHPVRLQRRDRAGSLRRRDDAQRAATAIAACRCSASRR